MTQSEIQQKAEDIWFSTPERRGLMAMGTGTGKSKLAINIINTLDNQNFLSNISGNRRGLKVFIAVPTEKLRDENWPEEFRKWSLESLLTYIQIECYASMNKYRARDYDLIVLDEAHRITENSAEFFESEEDYQVPVLALTATPPGQGNENDQLKAEILTRLRIPTIFTYSLDEAVADNNVADYRIYVVMVKPDDEMKYVEGGSTKKKFKSTEAKAYEYLQKQIRKVKIQVIEDETPDLLSDDPARWAPQISPNRGFLQTLQNRRMHMIYGLRAKTLVAKKILDRFSQDKRIIIFCGTIKQSVLLCGTNVYNSESDDKALTAFKAQQLNRLGVVNAMNEGHNIAMLDIAVIVQVNSNERDLVQRIGRVIRFRPGHIARIFIICAQSTQDEKWLSQALANFDKSKITLLQESTI